MTEQTESAPRIVRDGGGQPWEVEEVVLPACWASALVSGDASGLEGDPEDAEACRAWDAAARPSRSSRRRRGCTARRTPVPTC